MKHRNIRAVFTIASDGSQSQIVPQSRPPGGRPGPERVTRPVAKSLVSRSLRARKKIHRAQAAPFPRGRRVVDRDPPGAISIGSSHDRARIVTTVAAVWGESSATNTRVRRALSAIAERSIERIR
jgi:hypothetical protein